MEDKKLTQENIDENLIKNIAANVADFSHESTNFSDSQISQIVKDYLIGDKETKDAIQKLFPGIENIYKHIHEHKETTTNDDPIQTAYEYMNGDEATRKAMEVTNPKIKEIYDFVQEYKSGAYHEDSKIKDGKRRNQGEIKLKTDKFEKKIKKLGLDSKTKDVFLVLLYNSGAKLDIETTKIVTDTFFESNIGKRNEYIKNTNFQNNITKLPGLAEKVKEETLKGLEEKMVSLLPKPILQDISGLGTKEEKIEYYTWFEAVPNIQSEIENTTSEVTALRAINTKINLKNIDFSEQGIQKMSTKDLHKYVNLPEIDKISDESKEYIVGNLQAIFKAYLKTFPNPHNRQSYLALQGMENNILYELDVLDIYEKLQKQKEGFIRGTLDLGQIQKTRDGKFAKALTYLRSTLQANEKDKVITNWTRKSKTFQLIEDFYKNNKNIAESGHEYFLISFYQLFVISKLTEEKVFDDKTKAITEINTKRTDDDKSFLFTIFGQELVEESKKYNTQMELMKNQIELMNINNKAQKDYDLAVQCTKYGESGFWGSHYFYPPGTKSTPLNYLQGSGGITRVAKSEAEKSDFYARYGQVAPQVYRNRGEEVCEKYNKELLNKISNAMKLEKINIKDIDQAKNFLKKYLPASYFEEGKHFFTNWKISQKIPAPIFISDGKEVFGRRETPVIRDLGNFDTNKDSQGNANAIQIDKPTEKIIDELDNMIVEFKKDRKKGIAGVVSIVVGGMLSRYGGTLIARTALFELGNRTFKMYADASIDYLREVAISGNVDNAKTIAANTIMSGSRLFELDPNSGELKIENGRPVIKPIKEIITGESLDFVKSVGMFWVLGKTGNLIKPEGNPRTYFSSKIAISGGALTMYDAVANPITEGLKMSLNTLSTDEGLTRMLETRGENKPTALVARFIYNVGFVALLDATAVPKTVKTIRTNNAIKELGILLKKNERFILKDGSIVDRLSEKGICTDFEKINTLSKLIEADIRERSELDGVKGQRYNEKDRKEQRTKAIEHFKQMLAKATSLEEKNQYQNIIDKLTNTTMDRTTWKSDISIKEIIENSLKTGEKRTDGILQELKKSSGITFTIEDINLDLLNEIHQLGGLFETKDNAFKLNFLKSFLFTESGIAKVEKNAAEKSISANKTIADAAKSVMRAGYEGEINKERGFINAEDLRIYMTTTTLKGGQTIWKGYFSSVISKIGGKITEPQSERLFKVFNNFRENYFWKYGKDFKSAFSEFIKAGYNTYDAAFKKDMASLFGILLEKPASVGIEHNRAKLNAIVTNATDFIHILGLPTNTEVIGPRDGFKQGDKITLRRDNNQIDFSYTKDNAIFISRLRIENQQQLQGTKLFNKMVTFCQSKNIANLRLTDINTQMVWLKFGFELSDSKYHDGNMALNYLFNRKYKFEEFTNAQHVADIKKSVDEILKEFGIDHSKINTPSDLVALGEKGKDLYNRIKKKRKGTELEYDVSKGPYIKETKSESSIPDILLENDHHIIKALGFPERSRVITQNKKIDKNMPVLIVGGGTKLLFRYTNDHLHIDVLEVAGGLQQKGIGKNRFNNIVRFCQSKNIPTIKLRDGNIDMVWIKFGLHVSNNENLAANVALRYLFDTTYSSENPKFSEIKTYIDTFVEQNNIDRTQIKSLQDFLTIKNGKDLYNQIRREFQVTRIWGAESGKPELEFDVNKDKTSEDREAPEAILKLGEKAHTNVESEGVLGAVLEQGSNYIQGLIGGKDIVDIGSGGIYNGEGCMESGANKYIGVDKYINKEDLPTRTGTENITFTQEDGILFLKKQADNSSTIIANSLFDEPFSPSIYRENPDIFKARKEYTTQLLKEIYRVCDGVCFGFEIYEDIATIAKSVGFNVETYKGLQAKELLGIKYLSDNSVFFILRKKK